MVAVMMTTNFSELIMSLVKPLVRKPAAVQVTQRETDRFHEYVLHVDPIDVGRVIGRKGHVANALRTIVEGARSKRVNDKKIRLVIDDHRHN